MVIKPVPAQICDNCGEYTLDANNCAACLHPGRCRRRAQRRGRVG
ncbi:YgiT-type zinc finger protein [uncultured Thiohalocapsa sp.]